MTFIPLIIFALHVLLPTYSSSSLSSGVTTLEQALLPPPQYRTCLSFLSRVAFSTFFPRRLARVEMCPPTPQQALSTALVIQG